MSYFTLKSSKSLASSPQAAGGSTLKPLAKISGFAPALNSVQHNQIYFYPKFVGDYLSTYKFFDFEKSFFFTQKIAQNNILV